DAIAFLTGAGLMPSDAELRHVGVATESPLPVDGQTPPSEGKPVRYTFDFGRRAGSGLEVDGYNGEGITVSVGDQGVVYFRHLWRELSEQSIVTGDSPRLTRDQAVEAAKVAAIRSGATQEELTIDDGSLVYFSPSVSEATTELHLAWRITVNGWPYFVEATTGEILREH
ncbi:MAG: hypothetical protein ACM3UP_01210, partial [Methanocella sp.]